MAEVTESFAEWDPKAGVIAIIYPDGSRMKTGVKDTGRAAEKRRLVIDYPEGYHDSLQPLLGPSRMVAAESESGERVVVQSFPDADFSPGAVKDIARSRIKAMARDLLARSDWYLLRQLDTGQDVPSEVRELREETRRACEQDEAELDRLVPSEYLEFNPRNLARMVRKTQETL